jgi:hypothetical protein
VLQVVIFQISRLFFVNLSYIIAIQCKTLKNIHCKTLKKSHSICVSFVKHLKSHSICVSFVKHSKRHSICVSFVKHSKKIPWDTWDTLRDTLRDTLFVHICLTKKRVFKHVSFKKHYFTGYLGYFFLKILLTCFLWYIIFTF